MRRALAFCKDINTFKHIRDKFNSKEIQKELYDLHKVHKDTPSLHCTFDHIDGIQRTKNVIKPLIDLRKMRGRMSAVF